MTIVYILPVFYDSLVTDSNQKTFLQDFRVCFRISRKNQNEGFLITTCKVMSVERLNLKLHHIVLSVNEDLCLIASNLPYQKPCIQVPVLNLERTLQTLNE